ncbi:hypothetical protein [Jatrophihabitans endophyticus]|uniref:hypothetical protein n=1 Tax=Jatrophihabitans endophyticus TaxID=1206085 RepID=UPI001A0D7F2B|nr:hypothetical protein [Jatrophihabitans endophyticus]MBE7189644.1 hypothetical protein [Jatrophihabitans endophyticus]
MLDVAIRRADGSTAVDWSHVGVRTAPPLPVAPALRTILPDGLRRGSTVSVTGSLSLLLAVLGAASAEGAWCAVVGFGAHSATISAEAAAEYGIDLRRLAIVPAPGTGWTTAVGALLDALDIVVARPPARLVPGDVRRLAARARSKDAVLMPYLAAGDEWQGADVRLRAQATGWTGPAEGTGRLRARRVEVSAGGRGPAARPRTAQLWLPADGGGVDPVVPQATAITPAPVIELAG